MKQITSEIFPSHSGPLPVIITDVHKEEADTITLSQCMVTTLFNTETLTVT